MKLAYMDGFFVLKIKGVTIKAKDFRLDRNCVFHGIEGTGAQLTNRQVKTLLVQLERILCQR